MTWGLKPHLVTFVFAKSRARLAACAAGITETFHKINDHDNTGYQHHSNPIYIGKVRHQNNIYDGEHEAIIGPEAWDGVQACLNSNRRDRIADTDTQSPYLLTGVVADHTGDRLSPVHASKNGVRYCYYISNRLSNGNAEQLDGWRIPTKQIEQPILSMLKEQLTNPIKLGELINLDVLTVSRHHTQFKSAKRLAQKLSNSSAGEKRQILASFIHRIELHQDKLIVQINATILRTLLTNEDEQSCEQSEIRTIELNHQLRRRGVEAKLVFEEPTATQSAPDPNLIKLIAKTHLCATRLTDGTATSIADLAQQHNEDSAEISRFLPLGFLAPDIFEHILDGTQPVELTIQRLREISSLPVGWEDQRNLFGLAA